MTKKMPRETVVLLAKPLKIEKLPKLLILALKNVTSIKVYYIFEQLLQLNKYELFELVWTSELIELLELLKLKVVKQIFLLATINEQLNMLNNWKFCSVWTVN